MLIEEMARDWVVRVRAWVNSCLSLTYVSINMARKEIRDESCLASEMNESRHVSLRCLQIVLSTYKVDSFDDVLDCRCTGDGGERYTESSSRRICSWHEYSKVKDKIVIYLRVPLAKRALFLVEFLA